MKVGEWGRWWGAPRSVREGRGLVKSRSARIRIREGKLTARSGERSWEVGAPGPMTVRVWVDGGCFSRGRLSH